VIGATNPRRTAAPPTTTRILTTKILQPDQYSGQTSQARSPGRIDLLGGESPEITGAGEEVEPRRSRRPPPSQATALPRIPEDADPPLAQTLPAESSP
jgi:hypothetical protein